MRLAPDLAAPRQPGRRGAGLPRVDWNKLPRGTVANPIFVGRRMFDPARNVWGTPLHAGGSYPPDYFGQQTSVGWASRAWYTQIPFSGLPASRVNKHSLEVLVWCDGASSGGGATRIATRGSEYKLSINNSGQAEMEIYDGGVRVQAGSTVLAARTLYHIAMCYDGTNCRLYVNGVLEGTVAAGQPADNYSTTLRVCSNAGSVNVNVMVLAALDANNVAWSDAEVLARARNPWGHLVWPQSESVVPEVRQGGVSPIVGTLAATLANVTSSATGTLPIVGTLAKTLAATTSASTGTLPIAGTLAATLGNASLAATGRLAIAGAVSATLADVGLVATNVTPAVPTPAGGRRSTRGARRIYLPEPAPEPEIVMPSNIVRAANALPDDDEEAWILLS